MAQVLFSFSDTDALRMVRGARLPHHEHIIPLCDQNSSMGRIETFNEAFCCGTGYEIAEMYDGAGKRDEVVPDKSLFIMFIR